MNGEHSVAVVERHVPDYRGSPISALRWMLEVSILHSWHVG